MDKEEKRARFIVGVKKYIKTYKFILPSVFFGLMIVGMILSLIIPLRPSFSEKEKRELAKFPELSFSSLVSGEFFKGVDVWFSDTFPFREAMITVNGKINEMHGFGDRIYGLNNEVSSPDDPKHEGEKETTEPITVEETEPPIPDQIDEVTQALSNVLVIGNAGYEYFTFNKTVADKYISVVNKTAASLKGQSRVFSMLVPTSIDIMISDNVRKNVNSSSQSDAMDYIYSGLSEDAIAVNIYKTMRMHRDEYIYYRTDHHWSALGAYYAYCKFAETAGFTQRSLDRFTKESYGDFLGSFYSDTNSSSMKKEPDELIAYVPKYETKLTATDRKGVTFNWKLVNDVSGYASSMKYSAFTAGDNPYTEIENLSKEKGKTCVIVKESFGNAVIPYIVGHYKKVYVVDYRYYKGGILTLAKDKKANDVIFINNMSAVRNANLIERMSAITQ